MTMPKGKPKDHYIPQFYLDAFAIEGPGKITPHIYQYMEGKVVPSRISDVAGEKDYYTFIEKETGASNRDVDDFFTALEGLAAPVIQRIIREINLKMTDQERESVAAFFAVLAVRTPGFMNLTQSMHGKSIKEIGLAGLSDPTILAENVHKAGFKLSKEELGKLHDFVLGGEYDITFSKESKGYFLGRGLEDAKRLAGLYYKKHWHLLVANGRTPVITSDNPICIYRPKYIPPVYNAGYGNGTIVIPLSPCIVILMSEVPLRRQISSINEYMVKRLNQNTVRFSNEFVFGNTHTPQLEKSFNKTERKAYQKVKTIKFGWAPYIMMTTGPAPEEFIR